MGRVPLCGMAASLGMLIGTRVLQGLAGGGLQPSSQAVLLDAFPKEQQGAAQTVFGIAARARRRADARRSVSSRWKWQYSSMSSCAQRRQNGCSHTSSAWAKRWMCSEQPSSAIPCSSATVR